mgnify:FL=1
MKIPFVQDAYRGEVPVNWFPAADADKGVIAFGTPGLKPWSDLTKVTAGLTEIRGMGSMGDYFYAVAKSGAATSKVFKIDAFGAAMAIGDMATGSGPVQIINNNSQVLFGDGVTAYCYIPGTGVFSVITDADFPGASTIAFQDSYGIFSEPNSRRFWLTALNDFTSIDALDYASAEGKPGNIVAVFSDHRELWIFKRESIEIWQNSGASPFPFERLGGGFMELGCGAPYSIAAVDNSIYWLGNNCQIYRTEGYQPKLISNRKVEREISGYFHKGDAFAFTYSDEGHVFYQLTFPSVGITWVYDAATQAWHKRKSYPNNYRHRANCYAYFADKHLVGDYLNGKIYEMAMDVYSDDGEEIQRIMDSSELWAEGKKIPIPALQIVFDAGQGLEDGTVPNVMLSWSKDGGNTWSNEVWASAGKVGEYAMRTIFRRLGSAFSWIFRIRVSAPIKWRLLGVNRL